MSDKKVNFSISSLYLEPGVYFEVSHKIDLLVRDKMKDLVIESYLKRERLPLRDFGICISTKSDCIETEISRANVDMELGVSTITVWLPYRKIVDSEDSIVAYLNYLFDALCLVFKGWNIENKIRFIQEEIEREVVNNADYGFEEEYISPPDLSGLGIK